MTGKMIKDVVIGVIGGEYSIDEGASKLSMNKLDFERLLNAWENAQQAWGKMLRIAIISEIKNGKTDEEIMENLGCSESELERNKRLLGRTLEAIREVKEGRKTPACGSCVAGVYISEFVKMMEQEEKRDE